jgi:uncharacterized protein (DUF2235 family)
MTIMKRRLVVCSDGTWQDLNTANSTNVVKTIEAIKPIGSDEIEQIVYYDEGIGCREMSADGTSLTDKMIKVVGGGIGLGIDRKIQDAYIFLCLNYQEGDEIYLLGFSRGAYTVRSLAGLIYNSGLLDRNFIKKVPDAYALYRDKTEAAQPSSDKAIQFRQINGKRVPIKALCCWDTVASLGFPKAILKIPFFAGLREKYRFHDNIINPMIENAFHAVAVDETRTVYNVELMEVDSNHPGQFSQVWFPGTHGSIGGGSEDHQLSDRPLTWMLDHLKSLGLSIDETKIDEPVEPSCDALITPKKSIFGNELRKLSATTTFRDLDISVKQRWQRCSNYRPVNLERFRQELDNWNEETPVITPTSRDVHLDRQLVLKS